MSKHDKPAQEPVLAPAPGYCKHCKQYTIEEPLPAEPVQEQPVCDECGKHKRDGWALYCVKCVEPMFTSKTEPVEPVAWKDKTYESLYHQDFGNSIPLYTAPPQRKPLTEEEIRDLLEAEFLGRDGKRSWDDDLQVFRLAERAQGIT